jgi:ferredoxin, 2Fe-2S
MSETKSETVSITFESPLTTDQTINVPIDKVKSNSLLDIALEYGIDIDHACGGVCACSTCHVYIMSGAKSCSSSTEQEDDQLDKAPGLTTRSRLACQCYADGSLPLVVRIPSWNRNAVREGQST